MNAWLVSSKETTRCDGERFLKLHLHFDSFTVAELHMKSSHAPTFSSQAAFLHRRLTTTSVFEPRWQATTSARLVTGFLAHLSVIVTTTATHLGEFGAYGSGWHLNELWALNPLLQLMFSHSECAFWRQLDSVLLGEARDTTSSRTKLVIVSFWLGFCLRDQLQTDSTILSGL